MATRAQYLGFGLLIGIIIILVILLVLRIGRGSRSSNINPSTNCQSDKYESIPDPTTGLSFTCDLTTGMEKKQKKAAFVDADCRDVQEFPNCVCAQAAA